MTGVRVPDWKERLAVCLAHSYKEPFVRGQHDCTNFAIKCEKAITGSTLFPEFDQTYSTRYQGFRILKDLGYRDIWEICDARLEVIESHEAKRGDLVGIYAPDPSVGILANHHEFLTARKPNGIALRPVTEAHRFWRFPHGR